MLRKAQVIKTGDCYPHGADYFLIRSYLSANGWKLVEKSSLADLIVINTCAFTAEREADSVSLIKKAAREKKPGCRVVVTGCLPAINKRRLKQVFKGTIISAGNLAGLDRLLSSRVPIQRINNIFFPGDSGCPENREYFLRVGWGCNGRCAYCSVKFVFGKPRSRPPGEIIEEFSFAHKNGYRNFVLVANDIGSYGEDIGCSITDILKRLCALSPKASFVFSHFTPDRLGKSLPGLKRFITSGKIKRINIPVESGSDRILRLMKRKYTVSQFKDLIRKLVACNPKLDILTDIIVGFPSETERDFLDSLKLLQWLSEFQANFQCLAYSRRPFTVADKMPMQVPPEVKQRRLRQLIRMNELAFILKDKYLFGRMPRKVVF